MYINIWFTGYSSIYLHELILIYKHHPWPFHFYTAVNWPRLAWRSKWLWLLAIVRGGAGTGEEVKHSGSTIS